VNRETEFNNASEFARKEMKRGIAACRARLRRERAAQRALGEQQRIAPFRLSLRVPKAAAQDYSNSNDTRAGVARRSRGLQKT
jgi:hypothetical protein